MRDEIYDTYLRNRKHAKACGLSMTAVMVLLSLDKTSPQRVTELADNTDSSQQAIGKMLKDMGGYVHIREDSGDRRAKVISITGRGSAKVGQIIKRWEI